MSHIKVITIALVVGITIVGCGNSTAKKAIEQGKLAMASKEYDKALASFQLAIDEGNKDEKILKTVQIIEKYNEANRIFNEGNVEEAKILIDEISDDYKNYAIKYDIDKLKKEIDDTNKDSQQIKSQIEKLNTLFENQKYDEANVVIRNLEGKNLTDIQKKEVNNIKSKIKEKNEATVKEVLQ